jgi:hypothetical protein
VPLLKQGSQQVPLKPRQQNRGYVRPSVVLAVPPSIVEEARSGNAALTKVTVSVDIACASLAEKRLRLTLGVFASSAFAIARPTWPVLSMVLAVRQAKVDLCLKGWYKF